MLSCEKVSPFWEHQMVTNLFAPGTELILLLLLIACLPVKEVRVHTVN